MAAITEDKTAYFSIVRELAERLKNPDEVQRQVLSTISYSGKESYSSGTLTLSHGYPGLLLFFANLDLIFPDEQWDDIAHQYVMKIKQEIEMKGIEDLSLFGGLGGICFSIQQASKANQRYQKLLSSLNLVFSKEIEKRNFSIFKEKLFLGLPIRAEHYDVISGISGIGAYALHNIKDNNIFNILKDIIGILINLTKDILIENCMVPGWYKPSHYQFTQKDMGRYPKGNFDLGMAHGVAGILAILALTFEYGIQIDGQVQAIEKISDWLISKRKKINGRFFWVDSVSYEEEIGIRTGNSTYYTMDAWCYGTAGVARSLFLAGRALCRPEIQSLALDSFNSIFQSTFLEIFSSPTFCHGYAGLLILTYLMAKDSQSSFLAEKVTFLRLRILDCYQDGFMFGFKDVEPILNDGFILNKNFEKTDVLQTMPVDKVGLLDGTTGILLSMIGTLTDQTSWAVPFLIEGSKK